MPTSGHGYELLPLEPVNSRDTSSSSSSPPRHHRTLSHVGRDSSTMASHQQTYDLASEDKYDAAPPVYGDAKTLSKAESPTHVAYAPVGRTELRKSIVTVRAFSLLTEYALQTNAFLLTSHLKATSATTRTLHGHPRKSAALCARPTSS